MRLPLRITFKGMDCPEAIEAAVKERAEKLDRFCDDIMRLEPGYRVRFHEETGVKGPQASMVHVEGRSRTGRRKGAAV
jgi:ribosome-associated translation inhibitor RaiA